MSDLRASYITSNFPFRYEHVFVPGTSKAEREKEIQDLMKILEDSGCAYAHEITDEGVNIGFIGQDSHDAFWVGVGNTLRPDMGSKFTMQYHDAGEHADKIQTAFEAIAEAYIKVAGYDCEIKSTNGETVFEFKRMEDRIAFDRVVESGVFHNAVEQIDFTGQNTFDPLTAHMAMHHDGV